MQISYISCIINGFFFCITLSFSLPLLLFCPSLEQERDFLQVQLNDVSEKFARALGVVRRLHNERDCLQVCQRRHSLRLCLLEFFFCNSYNLCGFFMFFFQFLLQLCFILFMWCVYFFGQIPAVLACHFSPCFFDNYLYIQCLQNPTSLALSSPKFMPFCVFCWITFFFGVFFSGFQFSRFFSP